MEKLIEIKKMSKVYGAGETACKALDNINFEINKGDFIGIMGPSGSGKSTLLNIIATIDMPTEGKVIIKGRNIFNLYESEISEYRRENVGFIFQDCNLLDTLTIKDNIIAPLTLMGLSKKESDKRLEYVAEKMDIKDILNKFPGECSGGQRQRAAACRAFATNPSIIVADEPTGALDSKNSAEMLGLLKKLNEEEGITIIMVTHDSFIASYAKRLIFIRDGKLEEELKRENMSQEEFYNKIVAENSKDIREFFKEK